MDDYNLFLPAALALAHRALASRESRLRPAALIFRLGLATALAGVAPRSFAHRARCAAAILALAEALIFQPPRPRLPVPLVPPSRWSSSVPSRAIFS